MGRRRAPAPHRCRVGNLALSAGLLRFEHCHLRVQLVYCRVFRADVSARRPRRGGGGGGGGGGGTRSAGLSMRSLMRASSSANGTSLSSGAVGAGGSGRLFSSFHFARRSALRVTFEAPEGIFHRRSFKRSSPFRASSALVSATCFAGAALASYSAFSKVANAATEEARLVAAAAYAFSIMPPSTASQV